jgi:50S ribosomal protein L16 3-hydroxylase
MSDSDRVLLGGQTASRFLRQHWQKRARLVRSALPGFSGMFDRASLVALAMRDDVESRLVVNERGRYTLAHGPFRRADFKSLPPRGWTLLVQGLNLYSDEADALLRRFAFVPFARLDDLMASYAVPGGGVGPHCDSYDVFLLQGFGRRRWRYGRQRDLSLVPGLPLKILRTFTPEQGEVLLPGDMLYLPPQYAHEGVALEDCTTYSIGFRAASGQELAVDFLDFLGDAITVEGRYADPDLVSTNEPARIGRRMQRRTADLLKRIRWDADTVARFLGSSLSEPKPAVVFDPPQPRASRAVFARRIRSKGLALDRRTQLLYDDERLYVNGAEASLPAQDAQALRELANGRRLSAHACAALADDTLTLLHDWYSDGFLTPGQ